VAIVSREHYPYKIKVAGAPKSDGKYTSEVRTTVSEALANSARDTLMSSAQPALNPRVEIWGDPTYVYFDMFVDKPDDANDANQWRLSFSASAFKQNIQATVLQVMDEMDTGVYEKKHTIA
jgi:hypothetical protein